MKLNYKKIKNYCSDIRFFVSPFAINWGVKGRVQSRIVEKEEFKENQIQIIAEKVTFLSSKRED